MYMTTSYVYGHIRGIRNWHLKILQDNGVKLTFKNKNKNWCASRHARCSFSN